MVDQTDSPAVNEMIVSCATCDSVFRVHAGRQTCPCCGGPPGILILELPEAASPDSPEQAGQEREAGELTPAEASGATSSVAMPVGVDDDGVGEAAVDRIAEGAETEEGASRAPEADRSEPEAAEETS